MVYIFTVRRFCVVQKQKGVADAMIEADLRATILVVYPSTTDNSCGLKIG
jgi:hypothetical protein